MLTHRGIARLALFACITTLCGDRLYAQLDSLRIGSGFTNPLYATFAPGSANRDALYVLEQGGRIRTLDLANPAAPSTLFFDLTTVPGRQFLGGTGEQGLLGLAFDPNFATNGYFYVNYTFGTGNGNTRVERYTVSGGAVNPASRRTVLEFAQPFTNHNGGWIGFDPTKSNSNLYIASGDGGSSNDPDNNGQSKSTLLGKMLRVDVSGDAFPADANNNYSIPSDNPFVAGQPSGTRPEIWSYGLRNPWRASFDRATGDFWIADVGQGAREEVNFQLATDPGGDNYGWRLREGNVQTPGVGGPVPTDYVGPILDYPRTLGQSITGGYVYRGGDLLDDLGANLDGTYFYADFVSGNIWSLRYDGSTTPVPLDLTTALRTSSDNFTIGNISSFAEDSYGRLYIIDYGGEIFRVTGTAIPEPATAVALLGLIVYGWALHRKQRTAAHSQGC